MTKITEHNRKGLLGRCGRRPERQKDKEREQQGEGKKEVRGNEKAKGWGRRKKGHNAGRDLRGSGRIEGEKLEED